MMNLRITSNQFLGVFFILFTSPKLGEMIQFEEHIFHSWVETAN